MEMLRLRPSVSQSTPARQPEAQCEGRWAGLWGLRRGRPWVCALALRGTQPRPALFQVAEMRRTLTPANSPVSSPSKHGDRFIPSRAGANWSVNFHRINVRAAGGPRAGRQPPVGRAGHPSCPSALPVPQENEKSPSQNRKAKDATSDSGKDGLAYSALLKNELLGAGIEKVQDPQTEDRRLQPSTPERKGLFTVSSLAHPGL